MATTIHTLIDQLRATSASDAECGDRFERLMLAYLRTDPMWFSRFSKVWLWRDWPGREGEVDTGIDLVCEHRDGSGFTAVQCKCYAPTTTLDMKDLGTFFTRSGKSPFTERMIIATTNRWTKHLQRATEGQDKPTVKVTLGDLEASSVDWSQWDATKATLGRKPRKAPRPHQRDAIKAVLASFEELDRGKLIMACGTGKTYTGLRVAERLVGAGGAVLVLLPSISLLSQTLKEWASDASVPLLPFAVCSDAKAGRRRKSEDLSPNDLLLPATTDPDELVEHAARATPERMRVVFSTYQSIPVITAAQEAGFGRFDLVICDEAHRTTGVTLADEDDSNFTRVHDDGHVSAEKRLYMTATPRVYADTSKAKAAAAGAVIASMDDEAVYGPELYRLGFREAVDLDLLSDYKVMILAVDEEAIAAAFQRQLSDENHELHLDDATRIVGCLNALSKRNARGDSFSARDSAPMQTAVAFSTTIAQSKKFRGLFGEVAERYGTYCEQPFSAEVEHVDGSFNALQREELLQWLKEAAPTAEACRILSNARCLTEGVDVPALDAIIFLEPRNSMVDVIQAVGRVMRKAPGKHLGYVILPIGIPAGVPPEEALADNKRFKVVWQVLNALRSHDDRLNAVVNKLDLNNEPPEMVDIQIVGVDPTEDDSVPDRDVEQPKQIAFDFPVDELRRAIYAQLVKRVGTRHYWEDWAEDIARIAARHEARIRALVADPKLGLKPVFAEFVAGLQANLNDAIADDDALAMLSQHLVTRPVFEALFGGYDFVGSNPVSKSMQAMLDRLGDHALGKETETLDKFYADVKLRAEGIDNARGKQRIITELYERFFSKALPKTADALGIVYTPIEVVDFILRAAENALNRHLGASLSDEGVHVLDPFTGTGTFIVRLLQSGLVRPHDLARKYVSEIHANEILLLAYYIAAVNIESTYHELTAGSGGGPYQTFPGIVLTDTFQLVEGGAGGGAGLFPVNNQRAVKQQALDIRVIVSNPPWSVGQGSANDNAANVAYPKLDARITETYAARSTATLKNSLYDSYVRALRWTSDRVLAHADGGVVAFVSNGGYIDKNAADGIRLILAREYHQIYVLNLRGNQRTAGEQSRKEGGKIFGSGSRATVAILVAVKQPGEVPGEGAALRYHDIGDYLSREEKLGILRDAAAAPEPLDAVAWTHIRPNAHGDWIHQRSERFYELAPIHDKDDPRSIFTLRSGGLKTNRDAWNYNYSRPKLEANAKRMVAFFNAEVDRFAATKPMGSTAAKTEAARKFANLDATKFSWDRADFQRMARGQGLEVDREALYEGVYRPFQRLHVTVARQLNNTIYQLPKIYPTADAHTLAITVTEAGARVPFSTLIVDCVPDSKIYIDATQCFPLSTYEKAEGSANSSLFDAPDSGWRPNVSTAALRAYRTLDASLTAEDLFFYVYGILHARDYREAFAADLKKSLPRIPRVKTREDFWAFSKAGRALADLHVGYETVEPWPDLEVTYAPDFNPDTSDAWRVEKMRYPRIDDPETGKKVEDKTRVLYNRQITISGIPLRAHDYRLGSRSALDWVLNQYQVTTDKASGIVNDPNDWAAEHDQPRYIFDLLRRVVTVSLRTLDVVDALPPLDLT